MTDPVDQADQAASEAVDLEVAEVVTSVEDFRVVVEEVGSPEAIDSRSEAVVAPEAVSVSKAVIEVVRMATAVAVAVAVDILVEPRPRQMHQLGLEDVGEAVEAVEAVGMVAVTTEVAVGIKDLVGMIAVLVTTVVAVAVAMTVMVAAEVATGMEVTATLAEAGLADTETTTEVVMETGAPTVIEDPMVIEVHTVIGAVTTTAIRESAPTTAPVMEGMEAAIDTGEGISSVIDQPEPLNSLKEGKGLTHHASSANPFFPQLPPKVHFNNYLLLSPSPSITGNNSSMSSKNKNSICITHLVTLRNEMESFFFFFPPPANHIGNKQNCGWSKASPWKA